MEMEPRPKKLLDQVRDAIHHKHYFPGAEASQVHCMKRFICSTTSATCGPPCPLLPSTLCPKRGESRTSTRRQSAYPPATVRQVWGDAYQEGTHLLRVNMSNLRHCHHRR